MKWERERGGGELKGHKRKRAYEGTRASYSDVWSGWVRWQSICHRGDDRSGRAFDIATTPRNKSTSPLPLPSIHPSVRLSAHREGGGVWGCWGSGVMPVSQPGKRRGSLRGAEKNCGDGWLNTGGEGLQRSASCTAGADRWCVSGYVVCIMTSDGSWLISVLYLDLIVIGSPYWRQCGWAGGLVNERTIDQQKLMVTVLTCEGASDQSGGRYCCAIRFVNCSTKKTVWRQESAVQIFLMNNPCELSDPSVNKQTSLLTHLVT